MKSWLAGNRVPPMHDVKAGAPGGGLRFMCRKESLGLRHPLKSAIAAVLAVAMLVPTASAAPSVVLSNGTDGNAPTIAAADLVGNAEPEGIVDGSTIIISNYRQLTAIGTDVPVTDGDAAEDTFGTGRTISDEAGSPLTYALDATYRLAGTISMPQNGVWQLPAGFAGTFETPAIVADPGLYDQSTDTLYVHNVYQLAMLAQSDAADQPVMSNDAEPSTFGMGQPVMKADGRMLTYGGAANVALAMDFTTATPQGEAGQITLNDAAAGSDPGTTSNDDAVSPQAEGGENDEPVDPDGLDGRDYVGQVTKEINGTTYILIGNEQQLRAIGTGKKVIRRIDSSLQVCTGGDLLGGAKWETQETISAYYSGDADLATSEVLRNRQSPNTTYGGTCVTSWDDGHERTAYFTYDDNGHRIPVEDANYADTGLTYIANADYIIFRNIDLRSAPWKHITFSGTMIGAKALEEEALWDDEASVITASGKPMISNMKIEQGQTLNSEAVGVGFFGTLTNETDEYGLTLSDGKAAVSNLIFSKAKVSSKADEVKADIDSLGGLLNYALLLPILKLLPGSSEDSSNYATGILAGRVVGEVSISGIEVVNSSVINASRGYTGGLIGYSTGTTQYDGLSEALGGLIDFLKVVLDLIPGLGLGDLISGLLGSGGLNIDLGELIPVGYKAPVISDCHVANLNGGGETVGNPNSDFAGGFAGALIGTVVSGSTVEGNAFTVKANNYAGGFAGVIRNGQVEGTLDLDKIADLRLWDYTPQSLVYDSALRTAGVTVQTGANYAGGFAGGLAQAYMVNSVIEASGVISVRSAEDSAGGFAGVASIGWQMDLGKDDNPGGGLGSLLGQIGGALSGILSGQNPEEADPVLSLAGVKESELLGVQVSGTSVSVTSKNKAGGLLGEGKGTVIAGTLDAQFGDETGATYWSDEVPDQLINHLPQGSGTVPAHQNVTVSGLSSVVTSVDQAGGLVGSLNVASGVGLLNDTLGVANAISPVVKNASVIGVGGGFSISADEYAGGAFGVIIGGKVQQVAVDDIVAVSASNYAAGFMATSSAGDLAGTGGINLLGLNLVSLQGLLSVGAAVQTEVIDARVSGVEGSGMSVTATGGTKGTGEQSTENTDEGDKPYCAGGFVALGSASAINDAHVTNLNAVSANMSSGQAGGFVGQSTTAGLADVGDNDDITGLLKVDGLLGAVTYLLPTYTDVDVTFINEGHVDANSAGGFAGVFESGKVDNMTPRKNEADWYAVYGIDTVNGGEYAGGFGGYVRSGALADAGKGISVLGGLGDLGLDVNIAELLNVISAYVPYLEGAGVSSSERGLVVNATHAGDDSTSGAAGGFIGYASGVQISHSDVTAIRYSDNSSVADDSSNGQRPENNPLERSSDPMSVDYSVKGGRFAGGYVGYLNIGSAASVGGGLRILGDSISLSNVLQALESVVSVIEHSDVDGISGGYGVYASATVQASGHDPEIVGSAGGFAGAISGGHIQDSNSYNFSIVTGQESAGGYVGYVEPGSLANVLNNDNSILQGLVNTDGMLASIGQDFVASIRNSETTSVPCGGAVYALASSDATHLRGMAGGYVGHNVGGQIWGNNIESWKQVVTTEGDDTSILPQPYAGPTREAAAIRIRTVWGAEYAGGFTGLMEAGDTAQTGGLSLLWGLVTVDNLLGALSVAYATEENTAVYGPLAKLDVDTWNSWVEFVGQYGGYGQELAQSGVIVTTDEQGKPKPDDQLQAELQDKLSGLVYGVMVTAGRMSNGENAMPGASAGGYVGFMVSGTITNGQSYDIMSVNAMKHAGGFAGEAIAGGAASLGSTNILDLNLNLGQLLDVAQVFVPVIKNSSTTGWRSGMTVTATGTNDQKADASKGNGMAGGYIGYGAGVQIWGDGTEAIDGADDATGPEDGQGSADGNTETKCNVINLRRVRAPLYAGGFAGNLTAGSAANVNTDNASSGFLQDLLDMLVGQTGLTDFVKVLQGTMSTVRGASVEGFDEAWGFTVDAYRQGEGDSDTVTYPAAAGGFAGKIEATVIGKLNNDSASASAVHVRGLRGVDGGLYAGGFVGLADVGSIADVSGGTGESSGTSILDLIMLGNTSVLDVFQPCIYGGTVTGPADGITVRAHEQDSGGLLGTKRMSGNAGGFAGTVMSGTVQDSVVDKLNAVTGPNYTGGFIGYTGKTGVADAEEVDALKDLIGLNAGIADVFGAQIDRSSVEGVAAGYTVSSTRPAQSTDGEPIAGGFIGYADLAHVADCHANNLKRAGSQGIAGGFSGKTSFAYLVSAEVDSVLVDAVLQVVEQLLELLYLPELQEGQVISVDLDLGELLTLEVLNDGGVLKVTLLGLDIAVSLAEGGDTPDKTDDVVKVIIGDSEILLSCGADGKLDTEQATGEITVNLIKGNRSVVEASSVTGIAEGYDVFGGGATQGSDGSENGDGYAGGFVGFNNEGKLSSNEMLYADTIRGAAGKTGPFTGVTQYSSNWWFNKVGETEQNNAYHVYRDPQSSGSAAYTGRGGLIDQAEPDDGDPLETVGAHVWNRYDAIHRASGGKDAVLSGCSSAATANNASCNIVTLNDWRDAYTADDDDVSVEERRMLDVYRNAGTTAVLMADTPVSDNTGGLTPEPGEGQDPCGEEGCATIDLTVRKIWDDEGDRGNTRPEQIKYDVYMSYTDARGKVQYLVSDSTSGQRPFDETTGVPVGQTSEDKKPVLKDQVLSAEGNASEWSETWHDVIGSLPVGFWDDNGTPDNPDDDAFRYYTYSVKEQAVPGYVSSLDYDSRENVATITNGLAEPLPDTGGTGVQWIIAVGLLLAGSGLYWQWANVRGASCGGKRRGRHRATT